MYAHLYVCIYPPKSFLQREKKNQIKSLFDKDCYIQSFLVLQKLFKDIFDCHSKKPGSRALA